MEDNFRNVLIILSGIVIGAIFVHGLWTIRKQKNPYKLKTSKEKVEPLSRNFDGAGFDQDGVGAVKVTKQKESYEAGTSSVRNSPVNDQVTQHSTEKVKQEPSFHEAMLTPELSGQHVDSNGDQSINEPLFNTNDKLTADNPPSETPEGLFANESLPSNSDNSVQGTTQSANCFTQQPLPDFTKDELGDDITQLQVDVRGEQAAKPVYQQPVTQAKQANAVADKATKKSTVTAAQKRNQMEIDFDINVPSEKETTEAVPKVSLDNFEEKPAQLEPQVIILSVVMPANQQMMGAALLPSLLTLGMKYGEMNIFHRHQDNAGNGEVTFSLANQMNPGSFDLDSMETFATQGVSLFMTLPNAGDPFSVFEQMLAAAKQLAQEFNAQLLDDKRNVMTKQTEQHYMSRIREFDRKSRIAMVD